MTLPIDTYSFGLNLCLSRHMARIYGENQARAITRTARRIRAATKDAKMYELCGMLARDLAPHTVDSRRITGDEVKVSCVTNLERDMRKEGLL